MSRLVCSVNMDVTLYPPRRPTFQTAVVCEGNIDETSVVYHAIKVLLQYLIGPLSLGICLWIECGWQLVDPPDDL